MHRTIIVATAVWAALTVAFVDGAETLSDDATKEKIASFVTWPSRLCGRATVDFWNEIKSRKLTNCSWFDGDTNRLARLICELAQTNSTEISSMMIDELGKYGTTAQLPFLYSCATNPIIGDRAVRSVLNIEGVTSNSIDIAQRYLMSTNVFPRAKQHDRSLVCEELLTRVFESDDLSPFRPLCLSNALDFAQNVNTMHISLNDAIIAADPTYQYSKRRLAVMRAAQNRCVNQGLYNYVTNAINELVAYPEANLPD